VAVVDVTPNWEYTQAPASLDGSTATAAYDVTLDGEDAWHARPFLARRHSGIPGFYEAWSNDEPAMLAMEFATDMVGPLFVRVTVSYELYTLGDGKAPKHPLEKEPNVQSTYKETKEPVELDTYGHPIENTAGVPIKGIEVPIYDAQWQITRNEATYDTLERGQFQNSVNANTFRGAPAETCLMQMQARQRQEELDGEKVEYYEVTYTITGRFSKLPSGATHLDADGNVVSADEYLGWRKRLPNKGKQKRDDSGNLVNIKDNKGEPVSDPVWLDENGKEQGEGADRIFLLYETKLAVDWSPLRLD